MTTTDTSGETRKLEAAIQSRGRALLATVQPEKLITLSPAWWQERLMSWATSDPDFRVKLLRFVDVLPSLRTSRAVADHVRQYFRDEAPGPVRLGSAIAGAAAFRPVLSKVVRQGVFTMAERFIGGAGAEDALPKLAALNRLGTAYTVDLLGEAVLSDMEADQYRNRYLELIRVLSEGAKRETGVSDAIAKVNVSLKLSALTAHFEPAAPEATCEAVKQRLVPLLRAAKASGVFVNVDMEQYRLKDATHFIFEDVLSSGEFRDWQDAGIVVQAYLKDAPGDIERLREFAERRGTPVTVRLVKGAYWDEEVVLARQENRESPVFEDKAATDANYERCTELLVAAYPHLRPAFGTHNPRSITQAMLRVEEAGLPREHAEFQMLYGMAEGLRRAVQGAGYRTRVYVPVGQILPGMAYLVRRLLENTSNESWLVHRHEEGDAADLLAAPRPAAPPIRPRARFENATPAQFHDPEVRSRMVDALQRQRERFGERYPLSIGGGRVETGEWDEVRYPGEPSSVLGTVARPGLAEVDRAVVAAREAFPGWRDTPASQRAERLRRAAELLEEQRFDFAATMVFESGKPWAEADGDVIEAIDYLHYYALEAERLAGRPIDLSVPGEDDRYLYEGRGVAVVIAPWNFPLAIIGGMTTAALAAGCVAILKPAEQSPIVAAEFVRLLHEAGVPGAAVQYLPGPGEVVGPALVSHAGVDLVAFTGSNAVGLQIMQEAAVVHPGQLNVKRVIAEMGGKNAIIVDDDADLDQAVAGVVTSAFGYAGQKCSACSRVIAVGSAYQEFRDRLAAAVQSLVVGTPDDPYTFVPPVISADAREHIERYVAIGEAEGRAVARGIVPEGGQYVAPVVFENVPPTSRLACEEVFGPVLTLFRAATFDEALQLALDSPFALTGGVFSRNPRNLALARREFRVGNLYLNRKTTGAIVGRQPFGGFGMSGAGDKAGGPDYLLQFMVPRTITENTMRRGFAPG
jgi:RHH-type proline utilization regulon transcriptional repressor/proline dehydrogenase/delta 1-pyrroline-5-carboxylate dehydrogenase